MTEITTTATDAPPIDEIAVAMQTYAALPSVVDLSLQPDGLDLKTSDFPKVVVQTTLLDLHQYFVDALKDADFIATDDRSRLIDNLFHLFQTVTRFASGRGGGVLERTEQTVVPLPAVMSHGFVQQMTVDRTVKFTLRAVLPDAATFTDISGISFHVGNRVIGLRKLKLVAKGDICVVTPRLDFERDLFEGATMMQKLRDTSKDLLMRVLMNSALISVKLPIILSEFRQCLADAVRFKQLVEAHEHDLLKFIEKLGNLHLEDPITRAVLTCSTRIRKNENRIEVERQQESVCDLGGPVLKFAPVLKLATMSNREQIGIDHLTGVGIAVPIDPPAELKSIGVDLQRSLPSKITSLRLNMPDEEGIRRLVTGTTPGCWIGVELDRNLQPALDEEGNWAVFGVTNNPISGQPQRFYLRLDKQNNLNMTPAEITDLVTQTAIEGFDPNNPFTWQWGALALGGQTILAAGSIVAGAKGEKQDIKKQARKFGQAIGRLLDDL